MQRRRVHPAAIHDRRQGVSGPLVRLAVHGFGLWASLARPFPSPSSSARPLFLPPSASPLLLDPRSLFLRPSPLLAPPSARPLLLVPSALPPVIVARHFQHLFSQRRASLRKAAYQMANGGPTPDCSCLAFPGGSSPGIACLTGTGDSADEGPPQGPPPDYSKDSIPDRHRAIHTRSPERHTGFPSLFACTAGLVIAPERTADVTCDLLGSWTPMPNIQEKQLAE